jgi:hypothetical protein
MRTCANNFALVIPAVLTAALLAGGPAAHGQQPPASAPQQTKSESVPGTQVQRSSTAAPESAAKGKEDDKPSLEELLTQALKDNPDIRVAEAKVNEAEAELNRTRLLVMQKLVTFYAARKAARAKVANLERDYERARQLKDRQAISAAEFATVEGELVAAKAELERVEADMPLLLGKPPQRAEAEKARQDYQAAVSAGLRYLSQTQADQQSLTALSLLGLAAAQQAPPVPVAEKVAKALDMPITVDFKDAPLTDVLDYLQDKTGIAFRSQVGRSNEANPKITLKFPEPLPLRAVLQALEDAFPPATGSGGIRFVLRKYGLLVVPGNSGLPPGAILLDQLGLWQGKQTFVKNPPSEPVEGTVAKVDAKSGLVTLSVGSDAGLEKGHTLEVYRVNPAKYLGTVRVIQVTPHEAVAQPVGRTQAPIQAGDKAASKIVGN